MSNYPTINVDTGQWSDQATFSPGLAMRPVLPPDVDRIYRWSLAPDLATTWKYRGQTPPFEVFAQQLFQNVMAQYVFSRNEMSEPLALVSLYDVNLSSQRGYMSVITAESERDTGVGMTALILMLRHCFDTWPLAKVYFETNSISVERFDASLRMGLLVEEARLADFDRFGTESADLIYLSVTREVFDQRAPGLVRGL